MDEDRGIDVHARSDPSTKPDPCAAADYPRPMDRHDFGILLVHGIGEQRKSDTLLAFGDPLLSAIERWLSSPLHGTQPTSPGHVEIVTADLDPSGSDLSTPPHAVIRLTPAYTDATPQSWLVAENAWGTVVRQPRFGKLAGWLLTAGSWAVLSHALRSGAQSPNGLVRSLSRVISVSVALVAMLLLQVAIGALALLAVVPIPRLRAALSGLLLKLTGVLGDSYVLLESELQAAAIVSKAQRDLDWLSQRCRAVAVLAHSQGAAVAHRALRTTAPANVVLLVTFGSGLVKLEELHTMRRMHSGRQRMLQLSVPLTATAGLIALRIGTAYWDAPLAPGAFYVVLSFVIFGLVVVRLAYEASEAFRTRLTELSLAKLRPNLDWLDLYATHDPVSQGPLATATGHIDGVESRPVTNLRSAILDHTGYWDNETEFVPQVLVRLGEHGGVQIVPPTTRDALRAAAAQRARRVVYRQWIQAATLLGATALVVALRTHFGAVGSNALTPLAQWLPEAIDKAVLATARLVAHAVESLSALIWSRLEVTPAEVVGVMLLLIAVWLWNRLFQAMWRGWAGQPLRSVLKPGSFPTHPVDRVLVASGVIAAGLAPVALALSLLLWRDWFAREGAELLIYQVIGWGALALLCLLILAVVISFLGRLIGRLSKDQPRAPVEWAVLTVVPPLVAAVLWLLPGVPSWAKEIALALVMGTAFVAVAQSVRAHFARFAEAHGITSRKWIVMLQALPLIAGVGFGALSWSVTTLTDSIAFLWTGYLLGASSAYALATLAGKVRGSRRPEAHAEATASEQANASAASARSSPANGSASTR
jgi:hypothetical protein